MINTPVQFLIITKKKKSLQRILIPKYKEKSIWNHPIEKFQELKNFIKPKKEKKGVRTLKSTRMTNQAYIIIW